MAVPKKHTTKSHRDKRRSQIHLKKQALVKCSHCGYLKLPHTVCPNCGYYNGVEVINVLAKLEKKEKKRREEEIKAREEENKGKKEMSLEELSKKKF